MFDTERDVQKQFTPTRRLDKKVLIAMPQSPLPQSPLPQSPLPQSPLPQSPVELKQVCKRFALPAGEFTALDTIDLRLEAGQLVAVTGSSGSGKSTLLNLIAGLDRPTSGNVQVAGQNLADLSESALASFRGAHIGVVFQFFQLLPTLTALENILLAMDLVGRIPRADRLVRAESLLRTVGISDQSTKYPATLSGGQQQRVAIARALSNAPSLLVADEPTGNLDSQTASDVFQLLKQLAHTGTTVVVVTHETQFPVAVDRHIELKDGRIVRHAFKVDARKESLECTA